MATQPVEDIDAVLGRFQAWTGSREVSDAKAGIREISAEEALASGRYRWKPVRAGSAKNATPVVPAKAAPIVSPDLPARERGKTAAAKTPEPKSRIAKRKNHAASRARSQARSSPREKTQPVFGEVLAEAVKPAEVIVKAQPVELPRQIAISIRLAPSERALIKTRAAEAGITASAYIRQCALEVEQLREQVRQAVAVMERGRQSTSAAQIVTSAPASGFWGWMARRFLPRKTPALALRA